MAPTLYISVGSAPCYQVILTAKALNLDLEVKKLDLMNAKEHLMPEYVKLNPQHTVPTLVDGDFVLWESRAISRYLVNKHGAGSALYPQEPRARAVVDQRLDFDFGTLYKTFADFYYPQFMDKKAPEEDKKKKLEDALALLNLFLTGSKYVAGADLTIADLAIVASISVIEVSGFSLKEYPEILRWYELVKVTAPGYEETNQKNIDTLKALLEELKTKNA